MTRATRGLKGLVLTLLAALLLSGCDFSVADMPLPGGTDTGDDPIHVKAEFADVLDLVPQSTVKVNDVSVGKITEIELEGETAVVTMELPRDIELPANATAEIRQTSLLGEKFVQLEPPATGASSATLSNGATIPLEQTGRNPEVEEVLGALSLLLNGGGVAQLKTIAHELNLALEGREDSAKSVFHQVRDLMSQLDDNKGDIVNAIEALNRLSVRANDQIDSIDLALDELPSALQTIDQQRKDLVRMLKKLNQLGDVGVRVIKASKAATIDSFRQLVPVLDQFAASGDDFVKAFNVFLTYPFVDEVVGRDPQVARTLQMGDYTNLSVELDVSVGGNSGGNPSVPVDEVCTTLQDVRKQAPDNTQLDELLQYLQGLDDLCGGARKAINRCLAKQDPNRMAGCLENTLGVTVTKITQGVLDNTCKLLGIPADQCPQAGGGGGDGGGGGLPDLPDIPGLPRAPFGAEPGSDDRGPTMRQLTQSYDAGLVSLLVPGLVVR